jgi:hypothetical protein
MAGDRLTGEWCNFHWFQASDLSLGALVEAVPELVRDRVVVVTSPTAFPRTQNTRPIHQAGETRGLDTWG